MSLSPQQIQQNRKDFLNILENTQSTIPTSLINFLDNESDFWRAPASTRYHESYEGGLVEHSLKVYERLLHLNYQHMLNLEEESMAKAALFHDICKANFYRKTTRNRRMEDGQWRRITTYEVEDQLPMGHGEKSVAVLQKHQLPLTEEEMLAIRWHMGGFTEGIDSFGTGQALSNAMAGYTLVPALHIADMMSVWLK